MIQAVVARGTHLELGVATSLPATLANELVSFRFVTHATYGVTLESMTHLEESAFVWTNAQQSDGGEVTGQLWRVVQDVGREFGAECGAECGGVGAPLDPTAAVTVTTTLDLDGRPALAFRWDGLALASSGTVDVTVLVALGDADRFARWSVFVTRHGSAADALDMVECPILAFQGPVPARSGMTHAASQVRARALLPAHAMPQLGATNVPLTLWGGESLLTQHPCGYSANGADIPTQPYQFEALCAMDPDDAPSARRVLVLGSRDLVGRRKQFHRAGVLDGDTAVYRWGHRYFPPWATWPIADPDATSRLGNSHYSQYPAIVGCLRARTAAWWHDAAAFYRDTVAEGMAGRPKPLDDNRSDLVRGAPLVVSERQQPSMDGETLGGILTTWDREIAEMTSAPVAFAQWNNLKPTKPTPPSGLQFSEIRGTNYLPIASTSHCLHLGLVPIVAVAGRPTTAGGFFHAPHLRDELDVLADVGFNSIRLWGSLMGYIMDPTGYMASLKTTAQECVARGIGICYLLFSQIPAGAANSGLSAFSLSTAAAMDPATLRQGLWTLSNNWQGSRFAPQAVPAGEQDLSHWPEPATETEWETFGRYGEWSGSPAILAFQESVGEYVRAIADFFANDPDGIAAYHMTELYNEVNLIYSYSAEVRSHVVDFIAKVERSMRAIHPGLRAHVGFAGAADGLAEELIRNGLTLSCFAAHAYAYQATDAEFAEIAANFSARAGDAIAVSDSLPMILSEFYVRPENAGQMAEYIRIVQGVGAGGYVWCYIQNNAYRNAVVSGTPDYHGFSYPFDGLVTCALPMNTILTTDTLTFTDTGGECGREFGAECDNGEGREASDRLAIRSWILNAVVIIP